MAMRSFIATVSGVAVAVAALVVAPSAKATGGGTFYRPSCPYTSGTVVTFSKRLLSNSSLDAARESRSITLPPGRYKVSLTASDGYDWRDMANQPREKYYVELRDGSGKIATSSSTPDLQDYVKTATWSGVVNNELTVSRAATTVVARHTAYPDTSSPNSLEPICVQFVRLADPVNGKCGSANGGTFSSKPNSNLCSKGNASSVSSSGNTWKWSCSGSNGGSKAQCSATKAPQPVNGKCGSANGGTFSSKPTSNLCSKGSASSVNGNGPWSWSCNGSNGGSSAQCSADKKSTTPAPAGACPYSDGIIINFGNRLRSDQSASSSYQDKSVNIPSGHYKVKLAASDEYVGRENVSQPQERFFVEFRDGGTVVATTYKSNDLPDNKRKGVWAGTVNNDLKISKTVTVARAKHAAYPDTSSPNSLNPICAQLTRLPDPPVCGNNKVESGEQCDDGNTVSGDGCSAQCKNEPAQITIVKSAASGGDVQKVYAGKKAAFKITVSNTGKVALEDVVVKDAKSPACARSAAQTKSLYGGGVFAPGKSFSYTCESAAVTDAFTNVATTEAKPVNSTNTVSANDPSQVTVPGGPAIKIVIDDADNFDDRQIVDENGMATFTVTVTNIGEEDLKDVVITNALAPNCNRSAAQTKALYKTDVFKVGAKFTYQCKSAAVTKSFTDTVTVTGIGVGSGKTVTDDDPTYVDVRGTQPAPEPTPEPEKKDKKCKGSIGNTVWHDKNANGKQDANEPGIPGVRVWLYKGNRVYKDTTNKRGRYKFKDLCSGEYRVVVKSEDISALYQTYDPDGKLDHKTKVRLRGDKDHHTKADFGYRGAVAPATGPGTVMAIILAALGTGLILYFYHRKHRATL